MDNLFSLFFLNAQRVSIIETLSKIDSLEELSIIFCNLRDIPINIGKLKSINYLRLDGNNLSYLPSSFDSLQKLTTLSLEYNKITGEKLKNILTNLVNLEVLNLDYNNIAQLPSTICSAKLGWLYICDNPIREIPECLINSNFLRFLYLDCFNQDSPTIKSHINKNLLKKKFENATGRKVIVR